MLKKSRRPLARPKLLETEKKPLGRPKELEKEKYFELNSAEIGGREMSVIDFKDGTSLTLPQVERMLHESSFRANEPVMGKNTVKQIMTFLKENNPTREEFIKHFTSAGLNKGGVLKAHQGTIVYPQPEMPKELPQVPSTNPTPIVQPPNLTVEPPENVGIINDDFNTVPSSVAPLMPTTTGQPIPNSQLSKFHDAKTKTLQDMINALPKAEVSPNMKAWQESDAYKTFTEATKNNIYPAVVKPYTAADGTQFDNVRGEGTAYDNYLKGSSSLVPSQQPSIMQTPMNQQFSNYFSQTPQAKAIQEQMNFYNNAFRQSNATQDFLNQQKMLQNTFESSDGFKEYKDQTDKLRMQYNTAMEQQYANHLKGLHGFGGSIANIMPFNKGGTPMEKQMEQFEVGGMKDDGGEKDPVSGNEIPAGSLAKEVRDDIPALLSEGEFIFPADVTRFIGLDKLMEMRQDAKMGLKKMEMMGQLGDPEDAVLPDDIPFDAADIIIIDDEMEVDKKEIEKDGKYQGGIMGYNTGTGSPQSNMNTPPNPNQDTYSNITYYANQQYSDRYVFYQNEAGDIKKILSTWNGNPKESVPAGYKKMLNNDGTPVTEEPTPDEKDDNLEATQENPIAAGQTDDKDDDIHKRFYSSTYLADKFKGDVIYDANGNPRSLTEDGFLAMQSSASRLGLDMNTYFNLPMSAKMELLGEEIKGGLGKKIDTEKINSIVDSVKNGTYEGSGITGAIGGFFDWIGGLSPEQTQAAISAGNSAIGGDDTPILSIDAKKQQTQAQTHPSYSNFTKTNPYGIVPGDSDGNAAIWKKEEDDWDKQQETAKTLGSDSYLGHSEFGLGTKGGIGSSTSKTPTGAASWKKEDDDWDKQQNTTSSSNKTVDTSSIAGINKASGGNKKSDSHLDHSEFGLGTKQDTTDEWTVGAKGKLVTRKTTRKKPTLKKGSLVKKKS